MKLESVINTVIQGDCLEVMKTFPENSIDAIVTDPPAGVSFMGKSWDSDKGGRDQWIAWLTEVMTEAKRVLKPGGQALVWSLPRTSHWTGFALENAGFEVRDCVYHVFGSGFPKSLDISKGIDKRAGAERKVIGFKNLNERDKKTYIPRSASHFGKTSERGLEMEITSPNTTEAQQWSGWGTALKPAVECWWLCRKPLNEKTIVENVLRWNTGGLNIDGSRIQIGDHENFGRAVQDYGDKNGGHWQKGKQQRTIPPPLGRFPSHLIHDDSEEVMEEFAKTKTHKAGNKNLSLIASGKSVFKVGNFGKRNPEIFGDRGGSPARFFYCAKASQAERNMGCEALELKIQKRTQDGGDDTRGGPTSENRNHHPTVKPQKLMEYLIKLITPPGGIVLDPFAGSGSTLIAAKNLRFHFIGIEKEKEYCDIANARLSNTPDKLF